MEIDKHTEAVLVAYLDAHEKWKALPEGLEKKAAKRLRGKAHSEALEVIRLMRFQKKGSPE